MPLTTLLFYCHITWITSSHYIATHGTYAPLLLLPQFKDNSERVVVCFDCLQQNPDDLIPLVSRQGQQTTLVRRSLAGWKLRLVLIDLRM